MTDKQMRQIVELIAELESTEQSPWSNQEVNDIVLHGLLFDIIGNLNLTDKVFEAIKANTGI